MFRRRTSDLHMHLNGSFSLAFLERTAKKNKEEASYAALLKAREEYATLMQESKGVGNEKAIGLIWKQFGYIHKIVQSLNDIYEGTLDVVASSSAGYLEIRTTPKGIGGKPWTAYADIFVQGLKAANKSWSSQKTARGMLSLDRTIHTQEEAFKIIDYVAAEYERSGILVGIDISGDPTKPRKLTSKDGSLAAVINYALAKNLGLAIHVGEDKSAEEEKDVDSILSELAVWKNSSQGKGNFLHGRVRLGHGIYLNEKQQDTIKLLQVPMEICPSCHQKLGWWKTEVRHPVSSIYSHWKSPVVTGTDDELLFGGKATEENQRVLSFLNYPKSENRGKANEHQAQFRFGQGWKPKPTPQSKCSYGKWLFFGALGVVSALWLGNEVINKGSNKFRP